MGLAPLKMADITASLAEDAVTR
eukprot:SAG11_NODE_35362_length_267_cov_0.547619_1_plen_22_part_10